MKYKVTVMPSARLKKLQHPARGAVVEVEANGAGFAQDVARQQLGIYGRAWRDIEVVAEAVGSAAKLPNKADCIRSLISSGTVDGMTITGYADTDHGAVVTVSTGRDDFPTSVYYAEITMGQSHGFSCWRAYVCADKPQDAGYWAQARNSHDSEAHTSSLDVGH